jgi:hypothetical protein
MWRRPWHALVKPQNIADDDLASRLELRPVRASGITFFYETVHELTGQQYYNSSLEHRRICMMFLIVLPQYSGGFLSVKIRCV